MTFEESIKKTWSGSGSPNSNEYKSGWFARSTSQPDILYKRDGDRLLKFIPRTMEMDLLTYVPVSSLLACDFELVAWSYKRQAWEVPN